MSTIRLTNAELVGISDLMASMSKKELKALRGHINSKAAFARELTKIAALGKVISTRTVDGLFKSGAVYAGGISGPSINWEEFKTRLIEVTNG